MRLRNLVATAFLGATVCSAGAPLIAQTRVALINRRGAPIAASTDPAAYRTPVAHVANTVEQAAIASTPGAQSTEVDYDAFMEQDVQGRIRAFNALTPEGRAGILRTHIDRWIDANGSQLTPAQLAIAQEWRAFAKPENYSQPLDAKQKAVVQDLEARSAAVFSREQMRDAITIHGPRIPKK